MSAPVAPSVLYAEHKLESGEVASVALLRTRWANEGQAVLELTGEDGQLEMVEHCAWFLRGGDSCPAMLKIDDTSAALDERAAAVNKCLEQLVATGNAWGFESFEALS